MKRPKPGLASLRAGSVIELALSFDAAPRQRPGDGSNVSTAPSLCVGLTYLRSYSRMGKALIECVDGCRCAPTLIDALDTSRHDSLFGATELPATSTRGGADCVLRLTNRAGAGNESKFRLAGLYLSEPWGSEGTRRCMLAAALPKGYYSTQDTRFYGV